MKKIIALSILFLFTVLFVSCTDDPASVGLPLLKDEDFIRILELDSFNDSLSQQSKNIERVLPLGLAESILLGKKNNVSSSFLIRFFFGLNDTLVGQLNNNQVQVVSSKIEFNVNYHYGDKEAQLEFTAHRVTSDWDPLVFKVDNIPNLVYDVDNALLDKNMSDSLYTMSIENALVDKWLKAAADTNLTKEYGLYFIPSELSEKIVGFQALSSISISNMPKLTVIVSRPGNVVDTLSFYPSADVHMVKGSIPPVSERMFVQSGTTINSILWFDVSALPENAIINNANLTLTADTLNQLFGSAFIDFVVARFITDTTDIKFNEELFVRLDKDGTSYKGDAARLVQSWNRKTENLGMLITPALNDEGVELFSFYSSDAADPALRPRLEIIYTEKK